jgi:drug/metabolite transporter (DMT)-like permease
VTTGVGLAIVVALIATCAYNVGLVVEKRALAQLPPIDARHVLKLAAVLLTAPSWLAGFALMLCGFGLQVLALTLAPVSVVQPVLASGIVILLVLSRIVLRERLGRSELACVLAMAVAIVAIAFSAVGSAGRVGHHADGWLLVVVAAPAAVRATGFGVSALRGTGGHRPGATAVFFGLAAGLFYGVATLSLKGLSGALAGAGGQHLHLLMTLVTSPFPYVTVVCSALGMLVFQTGLQRCRVSIIGPISNISGSVFFIISGTLLFGEQLPRQPLQLGLRLAGIATAGVVVILLSRRPAAAEGSVPAAQGTESNEHAAARAAGTA